MVKCDLQKMQAAARERHKIEVPVIVPAEPVVIIRSKRKPKKSPRINPAAYLPVDKYIRTLQNVWDKTHMVQTTKTDIKIVRRAKRESPDEEEEKKIFVRPSATYSNTSPYGIAAQMLAEQMNEELKSKCRDVNRLRRTG